MVPTDSGPPSPAEAIRQARELTRSAAQDEKARIESLLDRAEAFPEHRGEALLARGNLHLVLGEYDQAYAVGERLCSDEAWAGLGHNLRGVVDLERGHYAPAMDSLEQALELVPEGDPRSRGNVENNLGLLCWRVGKLEAAVRHFGVAADAFGAADDTVSTGNVRNNLGMVFKEMGRFQRARLAFQMARDLLADEPAYLANALANIATMNEEAGDLEAAEALHRRVLQIREEIGYRRGLAGTRLALARLAILRNDFEEAERQLSTSRELVVELGLRKHLADVHELQSRIHAGRGDWREAYEARLDYEATRDQLGREDLHLRIEAARNRALLEEARLDVEARRLEAIELARARDMAVSALSYRNLLLATVSHEIRNPVSGILGTTSLLAKRPLDPASSDLVKTIDRSSRGILELLNDLLDLSKLEAGKLVVELNPLQLEEAVDQVLDMFRHTASNKGIRLASSYQPDLRRWVRGDALRIRQVLANLVGNAVKFTREGGVEIAVMAQPGDEIRFEVRDTGPGIDPEDREAMFRPFTQSDTSRGFGGTGLGLSISKLLVELMNGRIGADAERTSGATFWFALPLPEAPREASPMAPDPEPSASSRRLAGLRVLVAEDNTVNQMVIRTMLEHHGCQVETVENGERAVEAWKAGTYDMILMDCHMSRMDGFEASEQIRELETEGRTPIIAFTARPDARDDCIAAGMDDCVIKPVGEERLVELVARWGSGEIVPEPEAGPTEPSDGGELDHEQIAKIRQLGELAGTDLLAETIAEFRRKTPDIVRQLRQHAAAEDREGMAFEAHSLKGSAGMLGARRLASACLALEEALDETPPEQWPPLIREIDRQVARYEKLLLDLVTPEDDG